MNADPIAAQHLTEAHQSSTVQRAYLTGVPARQETLRGGPNLLTGVIEGRAGGNERGGVDLTGADLHAAYYVAAEVVRYYGRAGQPIRLVAPAIQSARCRVSHTPRAADRTGCGTGELERDRLIAAR